MFPFIFAVLVAVFDQNREFLASRSPSSFSRPFLWGSTEPSIWIFFILTQQIPSCTSWQPGLLSLCVVTELRGEGTKWEFCISFKAGHGWMWDGVKSCPAPERELSSPGMTGCGLGYLTALTQIWVICATSQTHSQSSSFHELIKINPKNFCSPSSATNRDFWLLSCLCHSGRKKAEFSKIWEKTEPSLAGH